MEELLHEQDSTNTDSRWIMRVIVLSSASLICLLLGLGYKSLDSTLGEIKGTQIKMRDEFITTAKEQNQKIDDLCKQSQKHESWLKVPFEYRQKYFMKQQD